MVDYVKRILTGQFEAGLAMFNDCVVKCPAEHWEGRVAKYPFWEVAYHTLCFVDLYLSPGKKEFEFRPALHPRGMSEFDGEHPSRRFEREEILEYVAICRRKAVEVLAGETEESLTGPHGFPGRPASRGELHIYNLRHLQHHAGQMGAYLRRVDAGIDPRWVGTGWK